MKFKLYALGLGVAMVTMQMPIAGGIVDLLKSAFTKKEIVEPPSIRVLIAQDQPGIILEVNGKYKILDPRTNGNLGVSFLGKRRMLQAIPSGIRWGEEFPGVYQIAIIPEGSETSITVDGVEYKGMIYVYNVGGSINIVNKVSIEEYLSSALPSQYPDPLPHELLTAIAIVSRSQAYFQAANSRTPFWDVDAVQEGYRGLLSAHRYKAIDTAIDDTQYMVLDHIKKGEKAKAPFSAFWWPQPGAKMYKDRNYSVITFDDAILMAKKGANAPEILKVAFPETTIKLEYAIPS